MECVASPPHLRVQRLHSAESQIEEKHAKAAGHEDEAAYGEGARLPSTRRAGERPA